jgi:hypothetical protein
MAERVIYCTIASLTMLNALPHEILHKLIDGVVATVQDETIVLSRQPSISLLFFSRHAYEQATRDLAAPEIEAVIRKRLRYWTPNATGQGLNWIYQSARRCLALTAVVQAENSGAAATRLNDHFEQSLQSLVSISGETRYQDLTMASLLVLVVEGEGRLNAEYLDAQVAAGRAGDTRAAQGFADAAKRSEGYGRALGSSLASLGRPEFTQGLPFIGLSRGVFVSPRDPDLMKSVAVQREAVITWKDGLVANWSLDDVPELEKRGKSVRVLYFNSGQLLTDLRDLTTEQSQHEFARRFESGQGGSMEARREHLHSLWLEQHLMRRKALAQAGPQNSAVAKILGAQVPDEAQMLRQALATNPAWLEPGTKPGMDTLRGCEDQLLADARFLAALSKSESDTNGEALFTKVSKFAPAQP